MVCAHCGCGFALDLRDEIGIGLIGVAIAIANCELRILGLFCFLICLFFQSLSEGFRMRRKDLSLVSVRYGYLKSGRDNRV